MPLTNTQIAQTLSIEIGLSPPDAAAVISTIIKAISGALKAGEDVRLRNFGRFSVEAPRRRGPSRPQGDIPPKPPTTRKVLRFKCSKTLKTSIQDKACLIDAKPEVHAALEHLKLGLEVSVKVQKLLKDHCRWVESQGREGRQADLSRFELAGADLFGVNLKFASLSGACLTGADLSDGNLENARLEGADLKKASLAWANLLHADLRGACLREADLRWADLRWADLTEADLSGANLSGADLNDTLLDRAKLHGAKLTNTILETKNRFSATALKRRIKKKFQF